MENEEYKKGFNDGVEAFAAEFFAGEALDGIEELLRELPIDYDSRCTGWNDFIRQITDKIKK